MYMVGEYGAEAGGEDYSDECQRVVGELLSEPYSASPRISRRLQTSRD